MTVVAKMTSL